MLTKLKKVQNILNGNQTGSLRITYIKTLISIRYTFNYHINNGTYIYLGFLCHRIHNCSILVYMSLNPHDCMFIHKITLTKLL